MTDRELNQEIVVPRRRGSGGGEGREEGTYLVIYTVQERERERERERCDGSREKQETVKERVLRNDQDDYNSD